MSAPPPWFRAGLARYLADLPGTTVKRKLIINALAVVQAEAAMRGEADEVVALFSDEALAEMYDAISADERDTFRRLADEEQP